MEKGNEISRRGFLFAAAAAAASAARGGGSSRKCEARLDPNRVAFIADEHIPLPMREQNYHTDKEYPWVVGTVKAHLAEILALDPLPAHLISLGDMSRFFGEEREYEIFRELLEPFYERGIQVTLAMGNHDIRSSFARSFPEAAAQSLVPGRYAYKVETPHADFLVLDTLKEPARRGDHKGVSGHELGPEQTAWAKKALRELTKPTFVCAHHAMRECGLYREIIEAPKAAGYLHGHDHMWRNYYVTSGYTLDARTMRCVGIGSLALSGDIGYAVMDIAPGQATLRMVAKDFYFPVKVPAERRPKVWDAILQDRIGLKAVFPF